MRSGDRDVISSNALSDRREVRTSVRASPATNDRYRSESVLIVPSSPSDVPSSSPDREGEASPENRPSILGLSPKSNASSHRGDAVVLRELLEAAAVLTTGPPRPGVVPRLFARRRRWRCALPAGGRIVPRPDGVVLPRPEPDGGRGERRESPRVPCRRGPGPAARLRSRRKTSAADDDSCDDWRRRPGRPAGAARAIEGMMVLVFLPLALL